MFSVVELHRSLLLPGSGNQDHLGLGGFQPDRVHPGLRNRVRQRDPVRPGHGITLRHQRTRLPI